MRIFPDLPTNTLRVAEINRVDFDEAILPEDSCKTESKYNKLEVERIADVRSGRETRFGRVHRKFVFYWKAYIEPDWVDEAYLNCGALLLDIDRIHASRNRFEVL